MKKRRVLYLVLALILILGAVGGTAAYYIAQNIATNVVTTGNIRAEIQEWADEEMTVPFQNYTLAMPGAKATKVVTVLNTGDYTAWIRLRVEKSYELAVSPLTRAALDQARQEEDLIHLNVNSDAWTEKDGWYYCHEAVKPGEVTAPLFTAVILDESLGNVWQGATVTIDVDMQAVQFANNGSTVLEAAGWPEPAEP